MNPIKSLAWKQIKLGSGGFGDVQLFTNKDGKSLVVKECKIEKMTEKMMERWEKECEIMLKLDHPYIVKCATLPEELKSLFSNKIVLPLEYCNKGDLRKELILPHNMCGLEEFQVKAIIHDISAAIQYLHNLTTKIFHRDLKPENIVLHKLPEHRIVYKIIDLGYAKEVSQDSICTSFVGTIQYLAPELFSNNKPAHNGAVDLWSFGTTVFECISGFRPFASFSELVQWLIVVKSKSDNDIYAYVNNLNQPVYSERLPKNNKIASASQKYYEAWLRLMLMYDLKTRGGQKGDEVPACYDLLEKLFHHKPLHVFNPMTNESHFHDVIDNKSISLISHLSPYFGGASKDQVIFVTTTGIMAGQNDSLESFCTSVNYDTEQELDEIDIDLIIVYSVNEPSEKRSIRGFKLDQFMNGRPNKLEISEQLKISKYLTLYCWNIYRSTQRLLKSTEGVRLWLLREKTNFAESIKTLIEMAKELQSKIELFSASLSVDIDEIKKLPDSNLWQSQNDKISEWNNLITSAMHLEEKYNVIECRIVEYLRRPSLGKDKENRIKAHFNVSQEIVESLKKSIDEQIGLNKILDMINCLQALEKDWDLITKECRSHIIMAMGLYKESMLIRSPIDDLIDELLPSSNELTCLQINRQKEIWKMIKNQKNQPSLMSMDDVNTQELCNKGLALMERAKSLLSEKMPTIESYDWGFLNKL